MLSFKLILMKKIVALLNIQSMSAWSNLNEKNATKKTKSGINWFKINTCGQLYPFITARELKYKPELNKLSEARTAKLCFSWPNGCKRHKLNSDLLKTQLMGYPITSGENKNS